jgi:hypothetical protein
MKTTVENRKTRQTRSPGKIPDVDKDAFYALSKKAAEDYLLRQNNPTGTATSAPLLCWEL